MKTILITGIGGDIAQGVAKVVRQTRPDTRLIGSDVHDQHAGTLFVDHCVVVPSAHDRAYAAVLREIATKYSIDLLIPVTEPEISIMASVLGEPPSIRWVNPGPRVVTAGDIRVLTNIHRYMEDRFERHLNLLRKR